MWFISRNRYAACEGTTHWPLSPEAYRRQTHSRWVLRLTFCLICCCCFFSLPRVVLERKEIAAIQWSWQIGQSPSEQKHVEHQTSTIMPMTSYFPRGTQVEHEEAKCNLWLHIDYLLMTCTSKANIGWFNV